MQSIWRCTLLALGYFLLAQTAHGLALPPGYASPIWPAAGLAVGGLLLWGLGCWRGVWVGAFAYNIWVGYDSTSTLSVTAPLLIASATSLQAVIGALLTRRFLHSATPLARQRDALYFLTLAGPLACMISSTLSIACLFALDRLPIDGLFSQWLAWWSGDTIGVLLFAPLVFLISPNVHDVRAISPWQLMLPLILIIVMVVCSLLWISHSPTSLPSNLDTNSQLLHIIAVAITFILMFNALASAGRVVAITKEINQRKEAEEKMRILEQQTNHAQRLQAIGNLAGGIAHDLNNTLTPILLLMDILKEEYPDKIEYLNLIEQSSQQAADMVTQLLTFAKGADIKYTSLKPTQILTDLESLIKATFPKNIKTSINIDKELASVQGDRTQLHQILLNLCVNARDAMPQGGTLSISAHTEEVTSTDGNFILEAKTGRHLVIRIADTGSGIAPEILNRIFDPFFTTKGPEKGAGLGLSTALGIVRGHHGFLKVDSTTGKGTTFTVYFPIIDIDTLTDDEQVSSASHTCGGKILLVDDEESVRELASLVLSKIGFTPITAESGIAALTLITEHKDQLCLIITDLHMPSMDGLELVRKIRGILPTIPIIIASGNLEDDTAEQFKQLGVSLRMDKPFTRHSLETIIDVALHHST